MGRSKTIGTRADTGGKAFMASAGSNNIAKMKSGTSHQLGGTEDQDSSLTKQSSLSLTIASGKNDPQSNIGESSSRSLSTKSDIIDSRTDFFESSEAGDCWDGASLSTRNNSYTNSSHDVEMPPESNIGYRNALEERLVEFYSRRKAIKISALFFTTALLFYLIIGVLFYSVWEENWTIAQSLLFIIYTITTVGYGNIKLSLDSFTAKAFTTVYLLIGLCLVTLVISGAIEYIILTGNMARYSRDRARIAKEGKKIARQQRDAMNDNKEKSDSVGRKDESAETTLERITDYFLELNRRFQDFITNNRAGKFLYEVMPLIVIPAVGAIVVGLIEGWGVMDSIYFSVVSVTTVGYGDFYPTKRSSEWVCILWLPFSLVFMPFFYAKVTQMYVDIHLKHIKRIEQRMRKTQKIKTILDDIMVMDDKNVFADYRISRYDSIGSLFDEIKQDLLLIIGSSDQNELTEYRGEIDRDNPPQDTSIQNKNLKNLFRRLSEEKAFGENIRKYEQRHVSRTMSSITSSALLVDAHEKASLNNILRALVQERIAQIIQHEILLLPDNRMCSVSPKAPIDTLNVKFKNIKVVANTWMIPDVAKESFALTALNILITFGTQGLKSEQLFRSAPYKFNQLLTPVMVAMEPPKTFKTWLASTEITLRNSKWYNDEQSEHEIMDKSLPEKIDEILGHIR